MSRASNLAGFVTSISPVSNLNVGVVTASSFVGNLTGNVTGTVTGTAATASFATTSFGLSGSPDITVTQLTATRISTGGTTGTTGQVLQSTGTGIGWTTSSPGGITQLDNVIGYNSAGIRSDSANGRLAVFGQGNFQVFTSPGTFVVNPGISSIRVRVVGAGGNGAPTPAPSPYSGGSGGGGGYAHKVITSFTAPRTYTVTVGSAPGGTSSFGSEVSATGGSNGNPSPGFADGTPGSGGTGSNGDVNFTGSAGQPHSSPTPSGGKGGAAATQLGNGSGASVPGLPSFSYRAEYLQGPQTMFTKHTIDPRFVARFPFDIFIGTNGFDMPPYQPVSYQGASFEMTVSGYSGGSGGNFGSSQPYAGGGGITGKGGDGGGGGRGAFNYFGQPSGGGEGGIGGGGGCSGPASSFTASGGSGGAGIVIVEW